MILTIYDLSGIQEFIFCSNELKDMIGGSRLVSKALAKNVPKLLKQNTSDWKECKLSLKNEAQIVYIGGGNAFMIYPDEQTEKTYTRDLNINIFEQSGGALKLCSATMEGMEEKSLQENYSILMGKLDHVKRITPVALGECS